MASHPAGDIRQERIEFLAVSFTGKMDSPIGQVLHKTSYLECPRRVTGGVSKTNSLDIAMIIHQSALLSILFQRTGPPCGGPSWLSATLFLIGKPVPATKVTGGHGGKFPNPS